MKTGTSKCWSLLLAVLMLVGLSIGATASTAEYPDAPDDYVITILTISHDGDIIQPTHINFATLEEHTGYKVSLEYVLNSNYAEQLNARLLSQNLPGLVVITGNTGAVLQAIEGGAFWDITDLYENYENLAKADKSVMDAVSVQGRYYGLYRSRMYPRSGMVYRSDWMENLGLSEPQSLEELYDVLYAFTYSDPDQNGQNDTYGMTWCKYMGPFYNLAVMHGAPNRWGVEDGKLLPWFEYDGFIEAMDYSKKLYENGLINQDFAALESGEWVKPFNTGIVGWHIDCIDQANRSATGLKDNGLITQEQVDDGTIVWTMGAVPNKDGEIRVWPQNAGQTGYVAISTSGAKTEQDLHYYLDFLDKCNDVIGQNILNYGTEGVTYDMLEDGTVKVRAKDDIPADYQVTTGWNQFMTNVYELTYKTARNPRQVRQDELNAALREFAIVDPTLSLASFATAWTEKSSTLNTLVDDAVINYIMGNIDLEGFKAEMQRWYAEGGEEALASLQAAYDAAAAE